MNFSANCLRAILITILVMDNSVWHKSQTLPIPENIEFTFTPSYTPEMNLLEQVWAEIRKRGFKNNIFRTLKSLINFRFVYLLIKINCTKRVVLSAIF